MAEPPAKRFKAEYTEILTVTVGRLREPEKTYFLHTRQATKTSKVLRDAARFNNRQVHVDSTEPKLFDTYAEWIYYGKLVIHEDIEQEYPNCDDMLKLYILGNYLSDKTFCNAVMDATIERGSRHGWLPRIFPNYDRFPVPPARMLQLFLRVYAVLAEPDDVVEHEQNLSEALIREYRLMIRDMTRCRLPTMADRCDYHDHEEGEPRCT